MKSLGLRRYALTIGAAAAMLAGCGGSQPPIGTPGAMPLSRAIATHADRGGSWMLPEAKTQSLVYATGGCGGVCIFNYPEGTLKAEITLTYPVGGDCSDGEGNVYVTNNAQILEYAHGGTTPIATLALPGINANACARDPGTGNLAVCGFGGNSGGNVAIYQNATGTPTVYDSRLGAVYCGYDHSGNLFVSGFINGKNSFSELPHGSSAFIPITLNGDPGGPGQVQWDGAYITLENQSRPDITVARLSLSGSTASVVGKTKLKGPKWAAQSWIAGDRIITPYSTQGGVTNKIGIWRYPKSGKIVVKFGSFGQTKNTIIFGVALSKS